MSFDRKRYRLMLVAVFLFLALSTLVTYVSLKKLVRRRSREIFIGQSMAIEGWLQKQFDVYESIIYGLEGFVVSTDEVTEEEWQRYVSRLRIERRLRGINSITLIEREEDDFVIKYVYPKERENIKGYNLMDEERRKSAINTAIAEDRVAISNRIVLVADDEPGFIMTVPIYKEDEGLVEEKDRWAKIDNLVNISVKTSGVFRDLTAVSDPFPGLDLRLYWGGEEIEENLLYDHDKVFEIGKDNGNGAKNLRISKPIMLGHDLLTLVVEAKPNFRLSKAQENLPNWVLGGGIAISTLIYLYFLRLIKIKDKSI